MQTSDTTIDGHNFPTDNLYASLHIFASERGAWLHYSGKISTSLAKKKDV